MCDKAVDNYPHALQFVPDCYMTQKCVIKLSMLILLQYNLFLNTIRLEKCVIKLLIMFSCIYSMLIDIKLKKCVRISGDSFAIRYVSDQYNTQQLCVEAVDDCLAALKFVPDWFATSKMLENLDNVLYVNDNLLFYNENFNKVKFIGFQRHFLLQPFFI